VILVVGLSPTGFQRTKAGVGGDAVEQGQSVPTAVIFHKAVDA
jgi:hypothetical protein